MVFDAVSIQTSGVLSSEVFRERMDCKDEGFHCFPVENAPLHFESTLPTIRQAVQALIMRH